MGASSTAGSFAAYLFLPASACTCLRQLCCQQCALLLLGGKVGAQPLLVSYQPTTSNLQCMLCSKCCLQLCSNIPAAHNAQQEPRQVGQHTSQQQRRSASRHIVQCALAGICMFACCQCVPRLLTQGLQAGASSSCWVLRHHGHTCSSVQPSGTWHPAGSMWHGPGHAPSCPGDVV